MLHVRTHNTLHYSKATLGLLHQLVQNRASKQLNLQAINHFKAKINLLYIQRISAYLTDSSMLQFDKPVSKCYIGK
jgi:hypothetical protein